MRRGAVAWLAVLVSAVLVASAPAAAQTTPEELPPDVRQAVVAAIYLISVLAVGGIWWAYREHMKAPPEAPPPPEGFCPSCGAPAHGRYCLRCGQQLEGSP